MNENALGLYIWPEPDHSHWPNGRYNVTFNMLYLLEEIRLKTYLIRLMYYVQYTTTANMVGF